MKRRNITHMQPFNETLSAHRTYLMGIAMVSVMLFHEGWINWTPFVAFRICGHLGVDIFLFLSGFGLVYSLRKHTVTDFYKRRICRILPLCVFCGTIKYLLCQYGGDLFFYKHISWLTIIGLDLWFLADLWVFYLFAPFIYNLTLRYRHFVFVGASIIMSLAPMLCDSGLYLMGGGKSLTSVCSWHMAGHMPC